MAPAQAQEDLKERIARFAKAKLPVVDEPG
ncbi:protein of unknown function [Methylacidimicrobium sp. AP8]|nr:protein of unknown function [Methylacidimicrobium sp. AP8]